MHFFYITNIFSVIIAEEIIKRNNINNPVALVANFGETFFNSIRDNMDNQLWHKIYLSPISQGKRDGIRDIIGFKKSLMEKEQEYIRFIKKNNISNVYLPLIIDEEEKIIYHVCEEREIAINFYEEGVNLYIALEIQGSKVRKYIKWILAGKYRYIVWGREKFFAKTLYCCFPEKYKFKNCDNKIKVDLRFDLSKEEQEILGNLDIDILFLSRPLSEDGLLTEEKELGTLKNFLTVFDKQEKKIGIKFHPRESEGKKAKILSIMNVKEIPKEYSFMSAEKLLLSSNFKAVIGYETGTLAYISELTNIETYSLLNKYKNESRYFNMIYDFYFKEFKNIKYIG